MVPSLWPTSGIIIRVVIVVLVLVFRLSFLNQHDGGSTGPGIFCVQSFAPTAVVVGLHRHPVVTITISSSHLPRPMTASASASGLGSRVVMRMTPTTTTTISSASSSSSTASSSNGGGYRYNGDTSEQVLGCWRRTKTKKEVSRTAATRSQLSLSSSRSSQSHDGHRRRRDVDDIDDIDDNDDIDDIDDIDDNNDNDDDDGESTIATVPSLQPSPSFFLSSIVARAGRRRQQQKRQRTPPQRERGTVTSSSRTPVFLTHERDFFRQLARLNSMDSYVLVSTLTASMSFGCLVSFRPATADRAVLYRALCWCIQAVSGLSALCGLYATIIYSLTILYGKSALGAERDREYDQFLRRTVRARVRGSRCFSLSLALFAVEAVLVLVERTSALCGGIKYSLPVGLVACFILYRLYEDWQLLELGREQIFKD